MRDAVVIIATILVAVLSLAFAQRDSEALSTLHKGLNLNLFVGFSLAVLAISIVILAGMYGLFRFWRKPYSGNFRSERH